MIHVGCRNIHCWFDSCEWEAEDVCHQIGSKRLSSTPERSWDAAGTPWQRTFPSLFFSFWALRACIMRPRLASTGSNCNTFYCSMTIWILILSWAGRPHLTIWKPEGSKSLYIMHDLRVPSQSSLLQIMNGQIQVSMGKEDLELWGFWWCFSQWVSCCRALTKSHWAVSQMYILSWSHKK